jgi:hypothetical protein
VSSPNKSFQRTRLSAPLNSSVRHPVIQYTFCRRFGSQFGLQTHHSNSGSRLVGVWCIVANKGVAHKEVPYIMRLQSFFCSAPNITLNPTAHPLRGRVPSALRAPAAG